VTPSTAGIVERLNRSACLTASQAGYPAAAAPTAVGERFPKRRAWYPKRVARDETFIPASPAAVWQVLSEPRSYGHWVVGSKEIRDVEGNWPDPGSRFHHSVGIGPFTVKDHTESEKAVAERRLELKAKARPLGTAKVTLELTPEGNGTRVVMIEDPGDALTALVFNPLTHLLVRGRNAESLRRLGELAVGRRVPRTDQAA